MKNFSIKPITQLFFNIPTSKINLLPLHHLILKQDQIHDYTIVLHTSSICFLKIESEKENSDSILKEIESCLVGIVSSAGKKVLMLKHYLSESAENKQIIRTELIYS